MLSLAERRGLARAMLADVLRALHGAAGFARCVVISRDPAALDLATELGAEPLPEVGRRGYRAAARQAAATARAAGATGLLILPADLPLLTSADLECLLVESQRAAVILAPSKFGGTNALLTRPPGAIPYLYGADSLRLHQQAAERRRLSTVVLDLPSLALDLDQPSDLRRLLESGRHDTATWRYLAESGIMGRLDAQ